MHKRMQSTIRRQRVSLQHGCQAGLKVNAYCREGTASAMRAATMSRRHSLAGCIQGDTAYSGTAAAQTANRNITLPAHTNTKGRCGE